MGKIISQKIEEFGYLFGTGFRKHDRSTELTTVSMLRSRSIADSADYFESMVANLSLFATTRDLHVWIAKNVIPSLPLS